MRYAYNPNAAWPDMASSMLVISALSMQLEVVPRTVVVEQEAVVDDRDDTVLVGRLSAQCPPPHPRALA